jgi:hypothetical protein
MQLEQIFFFNAFLVIVLLDFIVGLPSEIETILGFADVLLELVLLLLQLLVLLEQLGLLLLLLVNIVGFVLDVGVFVILVFDPGPTELVAVTQLFNFYVHQGQFFLQSIVLFLRLFVKLQKLLILLAIVLVLGRFYFSALLLLLLDEADQKRQRLSVLCPTLHQLFVQVLMIHGILDGWSLK